MSDSAPEVDLDIHMTRLAGWILNKLGSALLVGMGVAFLSGVAAVISDDWGWLTLGALGGWLGFAFVLYNAQAPMPPE